MRNSLYFALGLALAFFLFAPGAHALEVPSHFWGTVNGMYYTGSTNGNVTMYSMDARGLRAVNGSGNTWASPSASTGPASWAAQSGGGAVASRNITLTGPGGAATLVEKVKIPAAQVGAQVARVAKGSLPVLAASVVASYLLPYGIAYVNNQWFKQTEGFSARGYEGGETAWSGCSPQQPTAQACANQVALSFAQNFPAAQCSTSGTLYDESYSAGSHSFKVRSVSGLGGYCVDGGTVIASFAACPAGTSVDAQDPRRCVGGVEQSPATDADIDAAAAQVGAGSSAGDAAAVVSQAPWSLPPETPAELQVPSQSIQGTPSTKSSTDANGNVTTQTTFNTYSFSTSGDTINNLSVSTTSTTTTTTSVNGVVQNTEQKPADQEKEDPPSFQDSEFPALPQLYERKYPEGMLGVWNTHKDAILQSAFIQSLSSLFNITGGGGGCPSIVLGGEVLGISTVGDISPPCWVWNAMGLVILATACFTARAIIFGG